MRRRPEDRGIGRTYKDGHILTAAGGVIGDVTLGKEVPSEVRKESQLRVGGEVSPLASIYNQEFTKWASAYGGGPKFHASLCDVPFGIGFMGKDWDSAGGPAAYQTLAKKWGEAMLPLLYPGALVFMFGGTRTWHRLACGMEDAGFEMFDTVMWVHAQGFPKAQDIGGMVAKATGEKPIAEVRNPAFIFQKNSGQTSTGWEGVIPETKKIFANPWQGYKTPALKPAHEPILCLRAPRQRMIYAELARRHGTGALNVDAARIGKGARKWDKPKGGIWHPSEPGEQRFIDNPLGRYPANVIFDEESAKRLDAQSGVSKSRRDAGGQSKKGGDIYLHGMESRNGNAHSDEGGASRFFYVAKASKKERNAGCEDLPNDHPCVKPLDLCRYLATLLLPPPSVEPRRILVPFAGSGSEMIGAMLAGWDEVVGIEQNPHYCEIAKRRLQYWQMAVRPSSSKRKDAA